MFNSVTDSTDQLDSHKLLHIWHVQQCHRFPDQPESCKSFKQHVSEHNHGFQALHYGQCLVNLFRIIIQMQEMRGTDDAAEFLRRHCRELYRFTKAETNTRRN